MPSVLVDSNVILDIFTNDPVWESWSSQALRTAADNNRLVINPIVYAEISVRFSRIEDVDAALPAIFEREPIRYEAAFLAAKAYSAYRRHSGSKTAALPDFFIGAHAAVMGYELLTRDVGRYRAYFPGLKLVAPA
jgi:predicted nucleic acid-binding protein